MAVGQHGRLVSFHPRRRDTVSGVILSLVPRSRLHLRPFLEIKSVLTRRMRSLFIPLHLRIIRAISLLEPPALFKEPAPLVVFGTDNLFALLSLLRLMYLVFFRCYITSK